MKVTIRAFVVLAFFRENWVNATFPLVHVVINGLNETLLSANATPNLAGLIKTGIFVPKIRPEFPTTSETFVTSLVTGMHTEDHGVFSNEFYDEKSNTTVNMDDKAFWAKARSLDTIWDLVRKNGHISKLCNWPHANHVLGDSFSPDIKQFNRTETGRVNGSEVVKMPDMEEKWMGCVEATKVWLRSAETQLVSLYIDEPGSTAEIFGPENFTRISDALMSVDVMIGQLLDALEAEQHFPSRLNLIITSTPSFSAVALERIVELGKNDDNFDVYGTSPVLNIRPKSDKQLSVYKRLRDQESTGHYRVYIKNDIPENWHYGRAEHVQPLVLVADKGYAFANDFWDHINALNSQGSRIESLNNTYGCSGYNSSLASVQTFVVGTGPDLAETGRKTNAQNASVVDLFALLCELTGVDMPDGVAGKRVNIQELLRHPADSKVTKVIRDWLDYAGRSENLRWSIAICSGLVGFTLALICCFICLVRRCRRKNAGLDAASYRYTQVRNNRRQAEDDKDPTKVKFVGVDEEVCDDKQGLLTKEAFVNDDDY